MISCVVVEITSLWDVSCVFVIVFVISRAISLNISRLSSSMIFISSTWYEKLAFVVVVHWMKTKTSPSRIVRCCLVHGILRRRQLIMLLFLFVTGLVYIWHTLTRVEPFEKLMVFVGLVEGILELFGEKVARHVSQSTSATFRQLSRMRLFVCSRFT